MRGWVLLLLRLLRLLRLVVVVTLQQSVLEAHQQLQQACRQPAE
jgi:hypothetical protein